jgi:hypothetical protein
MSRPGPRLRVPKPTVGISLSPLSELTRARPISFTYGSYPSDTLHRLLGDCSPDVLCSLRLSRSSVTCRSFRQRNLLYRFHPPESTPILHILCGFHFPLGFRRRKPDFLSSVSLVILSGGKIYDNPSRRLRQVPLQLFQSFCGNGKRVGLCLSLRASPTRGPNRA